MIWWIAVVECHSALARVIRDKHLVRDDAGRAADALQLAAALAWCKGQPNGETLVCADRRLREAARHEGFDLQPGE